MYPPHPTPPHPTLVFSHTRARAHTLPTLFPSHRRTVRPGTRTVCYPSKPLRTCPQNTYRVKDEGKVGRPSDDSAEDPVKHLVEPPQQVLAARRVHLISILVQGRVLPDSGKILCVCARARVCVRDCGWWCQWCQCGGGGGGGVCVCVCVCVGVRGSPAGSRKQTWQAWRHWSRCGRHKYEPCRATRNRCVCHKGQRAKRAPLRTLALAAHWQRGRYLEPSRFGSKARRVLVLEKDARSQNSSGSGHVHTPPRPRQPLLHKMLRTQPSFVRGRPCAAKGSNRQSRQRSTPVSASVSVRTRRRCCGQERTSAMVDATDMMVSCIKTRM